MSIDQNDFKKVDQFLIIKFKFKKIIMFKSDHTLKMKLYFSLILAESMHEQRA